MPLVALGTIAISSAPTGGTELTVYNQGFALVKDKRILELKEGVQNVAIVDVAEKIEANSVGIRSLTAPGSFSVLEQNYQYDLISPSAILNKCVGKRIVLNRVLPDGKKERISGTLLNSPTSVVSNEDGENTEKYNGMVLQTDDGRILLSPTGEVEVPSIPDGLISRPTLLWELDSKMAGANSIELSYLTQGISWKADYVLNLDKAGKVGALKGWVTMTNESGASFTDAKLKLLAGDVQRVPYPDGLFRGRAPEAAKMDSTLPVFKEEQFSEYHLYTLQRPATVRNNEIKQLSLLEAAGIPVTKQLIIDATRALGRYGPGEAACAARVQERREESPRHAVADGPVQSVPSGLKWVTSDAW